MNTKSAIKVKVRVILKHVHKMASRVQSTTGMHPCFQDVEFLDFLFGMVQFSGKWIIVDIFFQKGWILEDIFKRWILVDIFSKV